MLHTLISCSKTHLRHKVEPILRQINILIIEREEFDRRNEIDRDLIKKALSIYKAFEQLLDSHLHMIIPFLCKMIQKESYTHEFSEIRKEVINIFICLA